MGEMKRAMAPENEGSQKSACTMRTKTAVWTDQDWSLYVPTASNSLKHFIQFSAQPALPSGIAQVDPYTAAF
jgi:hypothetical protein